jgi:hypothetical protein
MRLFNDPAEAVNTLIKAEQPPDTTRTGYCDWITDDGRLSWTERVKFWHYKTDTYSFSKSRVIEVHNDLGYHVGYVIELAPEAENG